MATFLKKWQNSWCEIEDLFLWWKCAQTNIAVNYHKQNLNAKDIAEKSLRNVKPRAGQLASK